MDTTRWRAGKSPRNRDSAPGRCLPAAADTAAPDTAVDRSVPTFRIGPSALAAHRRPLDRRSSLVEHRSKLVCQTAGVVLVERGHAPIPRRVQFDHAAVGVDTPSRRPQLDLSDSSYASVALCLERRLLRHRWPPSRQPRHSTPAAAIRPAPPTSATAHAAHSRSPRQSPPAASTPTAV